MRLTVTGGIAFVQMLLAIVCGDLTGAHAAERKAPKGCIAIVTADGQQVCPKPGAGRTSWFKDCTDCPELVVVPAGRFLMGPRKDEIGAPDVPHEVRFAKPFAVGRHAVTFAQWDACVDAGGCGGYRPPDQGWGRGKLPVVNVNWLDAMAYVAWLSATTHKSYRLMTESEREYVTRAGTTTMFWTGPTLTLDQANYDVPIVARAPTPGEAAIISKLRHRTVPVDSFRPNTWGLYNVHGNVWDWTQDCWYGHLTGPTDAQPAAAGNDCGTRVARGGSWNDYATEARSAFRIGFDANSRNPLQGFRVAREVP